MLGLNLRDEDNEFYKCKDARVHMNLLGGLSKSLLPPSILELNVYHMLYAYHILWTVVKAGAAVFRITWWNVVQKVGG